MNASSRLFACLFLFFSLNSCKNDKSVVANENDIIEVADSTAFDLPPDWAKEAIWYQIFVERFRNGDSTNDPTREDIKGTYPGFIPKKWKITPWTQDWYAEDEYFTELEGIKDFNDNPVTTFGQKSQLRRYGGDLQGVLDKIGYLSSLGITAIYFNPLNDAPSLHKYDARNWRHIDRNFGPNPKKDLETIANEDPLDPTTWQFTEADKLFLRVLDELHKRDIKVILDYSWNHTGQTFWAWEDLIKNQSESKYKDWYWVKSFDKPETEENEFEYKGWFGVPTLPEIKETEYIDHAGGIRPAEGNIYSEEVKQHIFNVTKRWLDPNGDGNPSDGVDGYRLDVAAEVPFGFWREYRQVVRETNPNAYLIGEVWWESWPDKLLEPKPFLKGDIFDAVMNYRWFREARYFLGNSSYKILPSTFVDSLNAYRGNLRKETNYAMMNLISGHDSPRVLTSLFNKTKYKKPAQDGSYNTRKPNKETYQMLKSLLIHQFTYVGAPHIWAGDEMGMWGADDPSNRKPLIWKDYIFQPEQAHPLKLKTEPQEVKFNDELFSLYQKLIEIRKKQPVLAYGDLEFVLVNDKNQTLAYSRFDKTDEILVAFNTSSQTQKMIVPIKTSFNYFDLLTGNGIKKEGENLVFSLEANSAVILGRISY